MKLRNRIIATLSGVALVVVGFAVPAAVADGNWRNGGGEDNPHTTAYWQNEYPGATCYKSEGSKPTAHGVVKNNAEGAQGVALVPFNQNWGVGDHWQTLIVKGGPDFIEYPKPNANQVYTPPTNPGEKSPDVSFWIVCKGTQETPSYSAPDCKYLEAGWKGSAKHQHINIKLSARGADTGAADVTLNFHNEHDKWSNPVKLDYTTHANFPDWAEWAVVWVQVGDHNYHWQGEVKCGEPDPEPQTYFICEWDAEADDFKRVEVDKIGKGQTEWVDGTECTPANTTICVADGNGSYKNITVADDGNLNKYNPVHSSKCDTPPVICENLGDNPFVPEGIEIVDPGNGQPCYYEVYICWELLEYVDDYMNKAGWAETYPQKFIALSDNWDEVKAHCADLPVCGEGVVQFQSDYYRIDSVEKLERLKTLLDNGYLTHGEFGFGPDDSILLAPGDKSWELHEWDADENCDFVDYCVWDSEKNEASKVQLREDEDVPSDGRDWTPWTDNGLDDCTPPVVEICAYVDGSWGSADVYEEDLPAEYTEWTGDARDCFGLDGAVDICHANNSGDNPFTTLNIAYSAEFNGTDWTFEFADGHGSDAGDIIPPFTHDEDGTLAHFPGQNWPAKFDGADGWPAWLNYLANDCETPVDTSVEYDSWGGVCADPNGGYTYTATVDSFLNSQQFFIQTGDGSPTALGTIAPGETATFGNDDLAPGNYTIYAEDFVVHSSPRVAENATAGSQNAEFTYTFSIDNPTGCADLSPTFLGGVCEYDAPYLRFTVVVNDPFSELEFPELGDFEFLNTKNDDGNTKVNLELRTDVTNYIADGVEYDYSQDGTEHTWTGKVLWPGAALDSDGNPIAWPGWETNADGTYTNVGYDNFGWTREGVDVKVTVNPEITVEDVNYPAATPTCDTPPPVEETPPPEEETEVLDETSPPEDEFTIVAGAPPLTAAPVATAVSAVATFTG